MSCNPAPTTLVVDGRMPSRVRSFEVYPRGFRPAFGLLGPSAIPAWPPKHPLEANFWWANAEGLCEDLHDVLLSAGYSVIGGDGALQISEWCISGCGRWAGFWLSGGTPCVAYNIRIHLGFSASRASWAGDVQIQVVALGEVPVPDPSLVTNNHDIVLLGGLPFPTGA